MLVVLHVQRDKYVADRYGVEICIICQDGSFIHRIHSAEDNSYFIDKTYYCFINIIIALLSFHN